MTTERKIRKAVIAAIRHSKGITVDEVLQRTPEELRGKAGEVIRDMESEGLIRIDLLRRCTLPPALILGDTQYTGEVSEKIYLKYSDAIGQFDRCPTYAEVLDFLSGQGVSVIVYRMTQGWRTAMRDTRSGVLVEDIHGVACNACWKTAMDTVILKALERISGK